MDILVNIDVDDLDKAVLFYRTAFGLRVGRRVGASAVEMRGGQVPIYLLMRDRGTPVAETTSQRRNYARHWTPVHLDFVVDDIEHAVETALGAGARIEGEIATYSWGRLALMADPFGHGFCFVQFLGHGYDEVAD